MRGRRSHCLPRVTVGFTSLSHPHISALSVVGILTAPPTRKLGMEWESNRFCPDPESCSLSGGRGVLLPTLLGAVRPKPASG